MTTAAAGAAAATAAAGALAATTAVGALAATTAVAKSTSETAYSAATSPTAGTDVSSVTSSNESTTATLVVAPAVAHSAPADQPWKKTKVVSGPTRCTSRTSVAAKRKAAASPEVLREAAH